MIDLEKSQSIKNLEVPEYPEGIAMLPEDNALFVATWFDGIVIMVDPSTLEIKDQIKAGEGSRAYGDFISPGY